VITILLGNRQGGMDMASQEKKCVAQNDTPTEEKSPDASSSRMPLETPESVC
jgi:hypothetical protein